MLYSRAGTYPAKHVHLAAEAFSPGAPVYAGWTPEQTRRALERKDEPSYMGTFSSAKRHVLSTFANARKIATASARDAGAIEAFWRGLRARRTVGRVASARPEGVVTIVRSAQGRRKFADWIVDVGLAVGEVGGQALYSGPPDELSRVSKSLTRQYVFADTVLPPRDVRTATAWLELAGVSRDNVPDLDVRFPLGVLTGSRIGESRFGVRRS